MTAAAIIEAVARLRPDRAKAGLRWGRRCVVSSMHEVVATPEGVIDISYGAKGEVIRADAHQIPPDAQLALDTVAVGECQPWECPSCGAETVFHVKTEGGFDVLWCGCTAWHRKPFAAGVEDCICQRCRTAVDRLDVREDKFGQRLEVCRYCDEEMG